MAKAKRTQADIIDDLVRALMDLTPVTECPFSWDKKYKQRMTLTALITELLGK